jgi:acetyltransferase-like isoleucine patch superfamily enzyme
MKNRYLIPSKYILFLLRKAGSLILILPYFKFIRGTGEIDPKITLGIWFRQRIMRINSEAYWPMHTSSIVTYPKNILIGKDTNPGYNPGCFIHGVNKIYIGDYTKIAPNVGIMSGNHDIYNLSKQTREDPIIIGKYCWIGMNSMILPGVNLGDHTIVAANSVVNRSFPEGFQVLAGCPAKVVKKLDPDHCVKYISKTDYIGYIKEEEFQIFRSKKLNV